MVDRGNIFDCKEAERTARSYNQYFGCRIHQQPETMLEDAYAVCAKAA